MLNPVKEERIRSKARRRPWVGWQNRLIEREEQCKPGSGMGAVTSEYERASAITHRQFKSYYLYVLVVWEVAN